MTTKITNELVLECIGEMRQQPTRAVVMKALVADGKMLRTDERLANMTPSEAIKNRISKADIHAKFKELPSKEKKFKQTVEMQVALKDYDPQKDKRFVGSVRLPNLPRPNLKICLIADVKHFDEVTNNSLQIDVTTLENLKKFNKDKKQIKKWAKKYYLLLATDNLVKKVPQVLGPILNRIGKFPQPVTHNEPLQKKIDDVRASVKWQLKKVTNLNVAVGNEEMTEEQLRQNIVMSANFLSSLLKKGWHNIKSINIKTTMGGAVKLL
jgi:large subunit ribosomal protein L10Ae